MAQQTEPRHSGHDVEPYALAQDVDQPRIHQRIFWCHDCKEEFVPNANEPASADEY